MAKSTFEHSEEWFEKLTGTTHDLSPAERDAVAAHVASCSECYHFLAEIATIEKWLDALPAPDFSPGLPPELLELWHEEDWIRMKDLGYL